MHLENQLQVEIQLLIWLRIDVSRFTRSSFTEVERVGLEPTTAEL
jgi:hypothetical protein